jgi:SPX domain protein involved in polyphosphate accumulation
MKFQVNAARGQRIQQWARDHLSLDPYSRADLADGYRVHTLYFDTPSHDLYRRSPGHARHKFRIRRYGTEPVAFLERKTRIGDRVMKRRTRVSCEEFARLLEPKGDPSWEGYWYWRRLAFRGLRPACRLSYDRSAYVTAGSNGAVRLTLDRAVACLPTRELAVSDTAEGRTVLDRTVIVELKFRAAMPALLKALVVEMGLAPRATSKYRLSVASFELPSAVDGRVRGEQR